MTKAKPQIPAPVDTAKGGERLSDEQLAKKLLVTTEQIANRCSVDMMLWNLHSNAVLDAAARLQSHRAIPSPGREEVIEECARIADSLSLNGWAVPKDVAIAIRALKGQS